MITTTNNAVLMDLGVARPFNWKLLTIADVVVSILQYSGPEQIKGENNKTNAITDIYATGITLYEMLTGNSSFDGNSQYDIMAKQVINTIPYRKISNSFRI